jgi:hypothetical protein
VLVEQVTVQHGPSGQHEPSGQHWAAGFAASQQGPSGQQVASGQQVVFVCTDAQQPGQSGQSGQQQVCKDSNPLTPATVRARNTIPPNNFVSMEHLHKRFFVLVVCHVLVWEGAV